MSNLKFLVLLFICSFSYVSHASVTVGTCKSEGHSYPTITAAISAASSGEVIDVCPGKYAEQLNIGKSVSIRGIGAVTLVFPPQGLTPIYRGSGTYSQVFVGQSAGPVKLSFLSIEGGDRFESPFDGDSQTIAGEALCFSGYLEDYSGVLSIGSATVLDHVSVVKHTLAPMTGGTRLTGRNHYCGGGIEFQGDGGIVRNSVVDGFGSYGIRGVAIVEHNTVSGATGAYSAGISASGIVANNTVTGPGFGIASTTGIQSSKSVEGNVVQAWATGIKGPMIRENHLTDNEIGLSQVRKASGNMILASATYPNMACTQPGMMCTDTLPASKVPATLATTGVDVGCADAGQVQSNRITGVGIGFEEVTENKPVPTSNVLEGVLKVSTTCSH